MKAIYLFIPFLMLFISCEEESFTPNTIPSECVEASSADYNNVICVDDTYITVEYPAENVGLRDSIISINDNVVTVKSVAYYKNGGDWRIYPDTTIVGSIRYIFNDGSYDYHYKVDPGYHVDIGEEVGESITFSY